MSVDLVFLQRLKSSQEHLPILAKVLTKVLQSTPPGAGNELSEISQIVLKTLVYNDVDDNYVGQNVCEYLLEAACTDD